MSRKTIRVFRASVLNAYVTCPMICKFRYGDRCQRIQVR
jgi:hypothetical protein